MARHAARALKAYGKFLLDEYEDGDPFGKLRLPKEPRPSAAHSAMATDQDLEKLLETCDRSTLVGERDYAIVTMLAYTGLRRGEVANLELTDLDMLNQVIHIAKGKTAVSDQGNPSSGIIENRHGVGVLVGGW